MDGLRGTQSVRALETAPFLFFQLQDLLVAKQKLQLLSGHCSQFIHLSVGGAFILKVNLLLSFFLCATPVQHHHDIGAWLPPCMSTEEFEPILVKHLPPTLHPSEAGKLQIQLPWRRHASTSSKALNNKGLKFLQITGCSPELGFIGH